jgi:hypothetical protein
MIDQHYALIITPLFDTQAPTCFGIHMPSSGSVLYPSELLEGVNGYVVVMYRGCWWPVCTGVVVWCATLSSWIISA